MSGLTGFALLGEERERVKLAARVRAIEEYLRPGGYRPPGEAEPPPPEHRVTIGASVMSDPSWPECWASLEASIGALGAVRLFDPYEHTPPANLFHHVAGKGLEVHSSTKSLSTDAGARGAYYDLVKATGERVVAYTFHEPDDNMAGRSQPAFSYDTWRAACLVDSAACRERGILYGACWQLYGTIGWPALFERLLGDAELLEALDVLGLDTYQRGDTEYEKATYRPWSYNGERITSVLARLPEHVQFTAPEFNVPEHPTDPEYRPTYLAAMGAQAYSERWRTVLLYNAWKPATETSGHVCTGPEFGYDTPECSEATRVVVRDLVARGTPPDGRLAITGDLALGNYLL